MGNQSIIVFLVILLGLSSLSVAAGFDTDKATAEGQEVGNQIGSSVSTSAQSDQSVQTTQYGSLYQSSVDNMMNGQKGQATAQIMSSSLGKAADTQSQSCDSTSYDGTVACATAGVLLGMAAQAQESSSSFTDPIKAAWHNVCQFSSIGCGENPPNPYSDLLKVNSGLNYGKFNSVSEVLTSNGFIVNQKTGIVKTSAGKTIDPGKSSTIRESLGNGGFSKLMEQVKSIEEAALAKVNRVSIRSYLSSLGLGSWGKSDLGGGSANELKNPVISNSDQDSETRKSTKIERQSRSTAGLFRTFNGDPIGVASESIFEMVSRRYHKKALQKSFFDLPAKSK